MDERKGIVFREVALASVVGLVAVVVLRLAQPLPLASQDAVRDGLAARDCLELGACLTTGPGTAVGGLFQGTAWIDVVTLTRALTGSFTAALLVVQALTAAVLVFGMLLLRRLFPGPLGLTTAALLLVAAAVDETIPTLSNPSLSLAADALFQLALVACALSGRTRDALAAGLLFGLGTQLHVSTFAQAPALALVAGAFGRSPLAVVAALAAVPVTWLLGSWGALVQNVERTLPLLLVGVAGLALLAVLGRALRGRAPRTAAGRALATAGLLLATFVVAALAVGGQLRPHHLHPLWPVASALVATLLLRVIPPRSVPVVVGLGVLVVPLVRTPVVSTWVLEAEALEVARAAPDWTLADLSHRLGGGTCEPLRGTLSLVLPPARGPAVRGAEQLEVTIGSFSSRLDALMLRPRPVTVQRIDAWLDPARGEACETARGEVRCVPLRPWPAGDETQPAFRFSDRQYPHLHEPPFAADRLVPDSVVYRFALAPEGEGGRQLRIADESGGEWFFTAAEGLVVEEPLPAKSITVRRGEGRATLVVENRSARPSQVPPCFVERTVGGADVR